MTRWVFIGSRIALLTGVVAAGLGPAVAAAAEPTVPEPGGTSTEPTSPDPDPVPTTEPDPGPTPGSDDPLDGGSASAGVSASSTADDPVAASTTTTAGTDTEKAPKGRRRRFDRRGDDVEIMSEKQWGMSFIFGGLAPMSISGMNEFAVNRLLFSELGFRRVFNEKWVLPFSVGLGVFHHRPEDTDGQNDFGLAATIGVQRNFRIWKRIVPHVGGNLHLHYLDPTGESNWLVNLAFGPVLGIEYFFADRVSLLLQGTAVLGFNFLDGLTQVSANTMIAGGGQMGLTFYF